MPDGAGTVNALERPGNIQRMPSFDAAIIGLGVMGSAALAALVRRGRRVIGIDRFAPGHDRGSSHGATRVIRLGYFEHPSYVPLVRAAYALWREREARSGAALLTITGIMEMGAPGSELISGTLQSARQHGLSHEVLDAAGVMKRFPAFRLPDLFSLPEEVDQPGHPGPDDPGHQRLHQAVHGAERIRLGHRDVVALAGGEEDDRRVP